MAKRTKIPEKWPGFEVAIVGEGLSPADINVRQLAELLEAAASAVETIARERGTQLPPPCLIAVRSGSAAYDLRIRDQSASPLVTEIESHIKNRGSKAAPQVRQAIHRLHKAGGKTGSVRFTAYDRTGTKKKRQLIIAPPLEPVPAPYDALTELNGTIVAVSAGHRMSVRLQLDDGKTQEFRASIEVARAAARLFLQAVRAEVEYEVREDQDIPGEITALERTESLDDTDIVGEFDRARDELERHGVSIRASDWLRELEEDS